MRVVRIGHSPDPDDAFMFYALTAGKVTIPGVKIEHVLEDIETLNRRSRTGELEVTAVSFATYLLIAEQYRMMDPGASMGKGYGPILVAREPIPAAELAPGSPLSPASTRPRRSCYGSTSATRPDRGGLRQDPARRAGGRPTSACSSTKARSPTRRWA